MTFVEKFEKISAKFKKADTSVLNKDFAVQVNLTDEDCGGAFYIANIDGVFSVEPYDYRDHTSMLTVTSEDFTKIISGKLSIDNGISTGRFEIEGNVEDIKALPALFPKAVRKPCNPKAKAECKTEAAAEKTAKAASEVKASPKKEKAEKSSKENVEKTNGKSRKL